MRVLLTLAVFPAFLLMLFVYKSDKVEKEPVKLLALLAGMGAVSGIAAVVLEKLFSVTTSIQPLAQIFNTNSELSLFLYTLIGVALIEEVCKFVFLKIFTWKNKEFNYTFDGIVYAVFIALGFAALENIFYIISNFTLSTLILRAILSIPGHMTDGVFMGYYYAKAKKASIDGNNSQKNKYLALALIVPTLLHGFYDYCLYSNYSLSLVLFFVFVIIVDIIAIIKIKKESKNDTPLEPPAPEEWVDDQWIR